MYLYLLLFLYLYLLLLFVFLVFVFAFVLVFVFAFVVCFFVFKPGQSSDIFGDEIGQDSAPLAEYRLKHAILACLHLFLATNSIRGKYPIRLVLFCILSFNFLIKCFISLLQQTQISIQKRLLSNVYTIGI